MITGNENVLRLDVPVNNSLRVRITQCLCNIAQNANCLLCRDLTLVHPGAQVLAADERHSEIENRSAGTSSKQRYDVRVLQPCSNMYLATEPIAVERSGDIRRKDLYHNLPVEVYLSRNKNARHAGTTELPINPVARA